MKKIGFVLAIALVAISTASAQGWSNWGTPSQSVSVNGTLQLQNGQIAVATGSTVYFVPTLGRYIGFINGLREGARVSIEGYTSGNYIEPSKVTIYGKYYDFAPNNLSQEWGNDYHSGYGHGGYGHRGGGHHGYGRRW